MPFKPGVPQPFNRRPRRPADHAMTKQQLNIRLSDSARAMLEALQDRYGLSQGGLIEMLIRDRVVKLGQDEGRQAKKTLSSRR